MGRASKYLGNLGRWDGLPPSSAIESTSPKYPNLETNRPTVPNSAPASLLTSEVTVPPSQLIDKLRTVHGIEELMGFLYRQDFDPSLPEWTEEELGIIDSRRRYLMHKAYRDARRKQRWRHAS